jgi:hypothetical protein
MMIPSDRGWYDDPISVAADHETVTVHPPPSTVPPIVRVAMDATEEESIKVIPDAPASTHTALTRNGLPVLAGTTILLFLLLLILLLLLLLLLLPLLLLLL